MNKILYTPEIEVSTNFHFIITVKNVINCTQENLFIIETENEAKIAIDSVASYNIKQLTSDKVIIFRTDVDEGLKVFLSRQDLGFFVNGSVYKFLEIEAIKIPIAKIIKSRLQNNIVAPKPIQPSVPLKVLSSSPQSKENSPSKISFNQELLSKISNRK